MSPALGRVSVFGDGAMGTLCALILSRRGCDVMLWGRSAERAACKEQERENKRYLPGHPFPPSLSCTSDPVEAFNNPQLIVSAIPCQHMRAVWSAFEAIAPRDVPIVSVAKGIENDTELLGTSIIRDCLGKVPVACLSGPCIAPEVAHEKPATVVVASDDARVATLVQAGFSTNYFRVYTSGDLLGVELAGAVKNVIALAAGISDGLECGENAKASLITRGLVEISRLGVAMGAVVETFRGLAGMGDLITTCASKIGRNRSAGERIGRGATSEEVVAGTHSVIEGIWTTRSVLTIAERFGVEMPIVSAVASVLDGVCNPLEAIEALMTRPLHGE